MSLTELGALWRRSAANAIITFTMRASSDGGGGDWLLPPDASHLPVPVLTELRRAQIPPESFAAMLDAFGELPEDGQYDLAVRIIKASGSYEFRKLVETQRLPRRHQQQDALALDGHRFAAE